MVKKTSGISYSPTGLIQEKEILGAWNRPEANGAALYLSVS